MSETPRDRSNMTPTAFAFMERVDRYRKRHPGLSEEDAIRRLRAYPSIADKPVHRSRTGSSKLAVPAPTSAPEKPAVIVDTPKRPEAPVRKPRRDVQRPFMFEPIGWFGHRSLHEYVSHLLRELGRLGLDIYEVIGRPSNGGNVLVDLLYWMDDRGNEHKMYNWQHYNLELLLKRQREHRHNRVKPRIDIHAYITARDNLSVVWYPTNWRQSYDDNRRREMCDFLFFEDDGPMFGRPANELMFLHGVAHLRPDMDEDYGDYLRFNKPVLDGILICAVRAAYETLIERLKANFEVTVKDEFVFEEEKGDGFSRRRILDWSLEDSETLQRKKDEAELTAVLDTYGFTIEVFREHLELASQPIKDQTDRPADYQINERLARSLTRAGHKITPTRVHHLRSLIDRCIPNGKPIGDRDARTLTCF